LTVSQSKVLRKELLDLLEVGVEDTPEIFQLVCNKSKIYESLIFIITLWKIMNLK